MGITEDDIRNDEAEYENSRLDLTAEDPVSSLDPSVVLKPYDPAPEREKVRTLFAGILLLGLFGIAPASFYVVTTHALTLDELERLLKLVAAPWAAILTSVVYFYFKQ